MPRHIRNYKNEYAKRISNPNFSHRKVNLKFQYGITIEQYNQLFEQQGRTCAVCETDNPANKRGYWHIDHNHHTKVVRAILCHPCNLTLGNAKECPDRLRKLANYIEKHNEARADSTSSNIHPANNFRGPFSFSSIRFGA